jgi:hypothetical protein
MGIEHSSTYFQASDDAHAHVIRFLLGVFSNKPEDILNAMFSPFFSISLQDAFTLSQLEDDDFREQLPLKCPQFHAHPCKETSRCWRTVQVTDHPRRYSL